MVQKLYKKLIKDFIKFIGDDPERDGLRSTPEKILESLDYYFSGYKVKNPEQLITKIEVAEKNNSIILLKNIKFYSFCEHHVLPIIGKVNVGYIADGYIAGIGDIIKLVSAYTRRLQVQERICFQIANCLQQSLIPLGVIDHVKAQHMCLMRPGDTSVATVHTTGVFSKDNYQYQNFLSLINS